MKPSHPSALANLAWCILACVVPAGVSAATITNDTHIAGDDASFDGQSIQVVNCTLTVDGAHAFTSLTLSSGAVLTHWPPSPALPQPGLDLGIAGDLSVSTNSRIDVSAMGYTAQFPGQGQGESAPPYAANFGGGGSYGGLGGAGYYGALGGRTAYGDATRPADPGSAGGSGNRTSPTAGAGGGAAHLTVGGTLTVDGVVSANGANSPTTYGGGGSGGSLWLEAGTLTGRGVISADGGAAFANSGGGGGGGRIALYYATNSFAGTVSARGGIGNQPGGAGTIYTLVAGQAVGQMLVENGANIGPATPLSVPALVDLTVSNQAVVYPQGPLILADLHLAANGWLTGQTGPSNLMLSVQGDLTIDAGSHLDVSALGYASGAGPGAGQNAPPYGSNYGGGGSCGGVGGAGYYGALGGTTTYGSITQPEEPGSGGGNGNSTSLVGGAGGGAAHLVVAGTLTVNGTLSADGSNNVTSFGGAGAGGSLWLETGKLAGSGTISADGGVAIPDALGQSGGGGGGGRIALYATASTFAGILSAYGGSGNQPGGAGTVYWETNGTTVGYLLVDNGDNSAGPATLLSLSAPCNLAIANHATVSPQGPLVCASLQIDDNCRLAPAGAGSNLTIVVQGDMTIDTGGHLDVSATGYPAAAGPGAGQSAPPHGNNYGGGGTYGGIGGTGFYGALGGATTYGSEPQPVDMGSGGGNGNSLSPVGGAGGGALALTVWGALIVNGVISAGGADSVTSYGGAGSGGSLWLRMGRLAGTGTISANGGASVPDARGQSGGGGGGGRVAVYYAASMFAGQLLAKGGSGNQPGGDGSVYIESSTLHPAVLSWQPGAGLRLGWTSQLGYQYQLLSSPNLRTWSAYGPALIGTGDILVEPLPLSPLPRTFYRVAASPAPVESP